MSKEPRGRPWTKIQQKIPKGKQVAQGHSAPIGRLQQVLRRPEYAPLGDAEIFEGTFLQLTKRGEYAVIHNQPNLVMIGILASSPSLLLPDMMVIARVRKGVRDTEARAKDLEITRLISLNLVAFYVHNMEQRQLKVRLANGRKYYLQLCAPEGQEDIVFRRWIRLLYMLHVASGRISDPISFTSKESELRTIWKSTSFRATPEKHWLANLRAEGSVEKMKEQLRQANLFKSRSRSTESIPSTKHTIRKPGVAGRSSKGTRQTPAKEGHTLKQQPVPAASKPVNKNAAKQSRVPKTGLSGSGSPPNSEKKSVPKQPPSRAASPQSLSAAALPVSQEANPSKPESQEPTEKVLIVKKSPIPKSLLSPSSEDKRPASQSPSQKEKEPSLELRRTMKSLAVGPSDQGWDNAGGRSSKASGQTSRPQSRGLETQKQSKDLAKQTQSSSATVKPEQSRSNKSKNKLKRSTSSARQRSSPTFTTIYSVLSSSLERLKGRHDSKKL